jgi:hypothetical protein
LTVDGQVFVNSDGFIVSAESNINDVVGASFVDGGLDGKAGGASR